MLRLISGVMLLVALALVSSCRDSVPPQIIICIGDGFGGADCDIPGEGKKYRSPTELENYWMTSQEDMARFASWCYGVSPEEVKSDMAKLASEIKE